MKIETLKEIAKSQKSKGSFAYIIDVFNNQDEYRNFADFAQRLVQAHESHAIRLAECDMPQTCERWKLADSRISYKASEFYFIRVTD